MRKAFFAAIMAVLVSGCCGTLSRESAFHDGVKQYAIDSGLLDEYEKYVEKDASLLGSTREIRRNTAKGFRALIAEEEKALKED